MSEQKIFIIGLPRTSTTSVCLATLQLGLKTAHTAYIHQTMAQAQVIADTPIFCDYQQLDLQYPNAKYIYLTRKPELWIPSIRQLLQRMYKNLQRTDGGFNPILKRCYNTVFSPLTENNISQDEFLLECYQRHFQEAKDFFTDRQQDLLIIDVSQENSYCALVEFLAIKEKINGQQGFEHINIGGKVTAWKNIKHPLKIEATKRGRVDKVG
ncbi:MAG: sulfotransferase family protein [Colwellia sp.]|nr:sulfotransferase family protein [Colwellia sp.]